MNSSLFQYIIQRNENENKRTEQWLSTRNTYKYTYTYEFSFNKVKKKKKNQNKQTEKQKTFKNVSHDLNTPTSTWQRCRSSEKLLGLLFEGKMEYFLAEYLSLVKNQTFCITN